METTALVGYETRRIDLTRTVLYLATFLILTPITLTVSFLPLVSLQ